MKKLSKEELLEWTHRFYNQWYSTCSHLMAEDGEQAYQQIKKLIEEKPKVTEEFVER